MSDQTPFVTYEATSLLDADEAGSQQAENDDLASLLQRREHARPTRLTWVLLTLLVLTVGFIGGAFAGQQLGTSTSSGGTAFAMPAGMPTSFPFGDAVAGDAALDPGMTTGTIKLVDGQNLYLTDSSGNTVKVLVPKTAAITSQETASLADLAVGTTVLVQGETATDGTVTATSVADAGLPASTPVSSSAAPAASASVLPSPTPSAQGAN